MLNSYLKLMRPYQWIKNLFCLVGLIFSFKFNNSHLLFLSLVGFCAFCLASSSVYVFNDLYDVEEDRQYPKKKNRPIASGAISKLNAVMFYSFLVALSLTLAALVNCLVFSLVLTYILTNVYYTLHGKHVVILDVFIISFGFILRVLVGTIGLNIPPSEWLIVCVINITLFLGFAKRSSEVIQCEKIRSSIVLKRKVLEDYETRMLDAFVAITAASAIISYALFVLVGKNVPHLIYTIPFVIYGIFRYIYLLYTQTGGQDTANDLLDDKHLIVTVICWVVIYLGVLWL